MNLYSKSLHIIYFTILKMCFYIYFISNIKICYIFYTKLDFKMNNVIN